MMSNTEAKKEQIFQMKSGVCQNQNTGTHVRFHLLVHMCAHGCTHKHVYSHTNRAWVKYKTKALARGIKHQSKTHLGQNKVLENKYHALVHTPTFVSTFLWKSTLLLPLMLPVLKAKCTSRLEKQVG